MKAVTAETMQELDRLTIAQFGVSGMELMERAGAGCADIIHKRYGSGGEKRVAVFAGKGNNGGDGYVIARILHELGWYVTIFLHASRDEIHGDALTNLDRMPEGVMRVDVEAGDLAEVGERVGTSDLIVDALLGTGLRNEVSAFYAASIGLINASSRPVVSVDIPSGVDASSGRILGTAVRADLTVTFATAKLGQILYPGAEQTGELQVVDIGIPSELTSAAQSVEYVDADCAAAVMRRRSRVCHKGDNGHSLIIAGSTGKSGAAAMAANSAMRSGAGLVTLAVPESIHSILEVKSTEAMTVPLADNGAGELSMDALARIMDLLPGRDVVVIGPGLGLADETWRLVRGVIASVSVPLVMDADALNAVVGYLDAVRNSPSAAVVMTPHPGEMARLANVSVADVESDRLGMAARFATENGVYLILKGAKTVIAAPDGRLAVNSSGNPGMASGGMGDVLTGVVTAFLAQGYESFAACCLAVYCHGAAGDLVAEDKGEVGLIATDVQEMLPYVFKMLVERRQANAYR